MENKQKTNGNFGYQPDDLSEHRGYQPTIKVPQNPQGGYKPKSITTQPPNTGSSAKSPKSE